MIDFKSKKRKNLLKLGANIILEGYISEKNWKAKDCGYLVIFSYNEVEVYCCEKDALMAFSSALEAIEDLNEGRL